MNKTTQPTLTIALCGNPNSGKTTLFNKLTGSNQKVGNWPGVTVEQKKGFCKSRPDIAIVDTPGVYSLSPYATDERITGEYLLNGKPDVILNVVDATNLERSLLLTTQLLELDTPLIVALNMQDEALTKGITVNESKLEKFFGCKFVPISAAKGDGMQKLIDCLSDLSCAKHGNRLRFNNEIENELKRIAETKQFADNGRWRAITSDTAQSTQIIEERYRQIESIVASVQTVDKTAEKSKRAKLTNKIDNVVLNKWLAFPIFFIAMAIIFYLSIDGLGGMLTELINDKLTPLLKTTATKLLTTASAPWLTSLVTDGIISGVMSVVGFTPQIMILFGCISALEASGYMSRIAVITGRLLNKIGLAGRSFVSMILGCGCSVPAIMSTRTIKNVNERNATITLAPFVPCSAKLAVISFFTAKIFNGNALFAISFYIVSILAVIIGGLVLKLFNRSKNDSDAFVMELPEYRLPQAANVLKQMWERGKAFLLKAGTVILTASIILWLLQNFNFRFEFAETDNSILAEIGKFISPVFTPLGFNDRGYGWQFSVATLTGIFAKETVVTTVGILLPAAPSECISPLGAYCFVTYNLLTVPCIAAVSASFTEQGGLKNGSKSMLFQIATAYVITLTIYQIGTLFAKYRQAAIIAITVICIAVIFALSVVYAFKKRKCCYDCKHCSHKC